MAVKSQNGWSANDRSMIASYAIPGGKVALRKGDVSVVLIWCANYWHENVEPLRWPGNWGYAERPVRGSTTTLSNHASGTAIDLNAPLHPLGKRGTFSAAQVRAVRAMLGFCEGVVRWGEDYRSRPDGMHLEVNAGAADVRRVADKIRALQSVKVIAEAVRSPEDDPMADVKLDLYDTGVFRGTTMAETASLVASDAYVTCGSTWGFSQYEVTALRWDGLVLVQWQPDVANNQQWGQKLPAGTRMVTFEGKTEVSRADPRVQRGEMWHTLPAAAIWTLPPR